jgi:putative oxidoreductase
MPIENGGVSPALYAWSFLAIAVVGAGPWSLDALIARRRDPAAATAPERVLADSRN